MGNQGSADGTESMEVSKSDLRFSVQHRFRSTRRIPHRMAMRQGSWKASMYGEQLADVHADARLHPCRPRPSVQSSFWARVGDAALYEALGYWHLLPTARFTEHAANGQSCMVGSLHAA